MAQQKMGSYYERGKKKIGAVGGSAMGGAVLKSAVEGKRSPRDLGAEKDSIAHFRESSAGSAKAAMREKEPKKKKPRGPPGNAGLLENGAVEKRRSGKEEGKPKGVWKKKMGKMLLHESRKSRGGGRATPT